MCYIPQRLWSVCMYVCSSVLAPDNLIHASAIKINKKK